MSENGYFAAAAGATTLAVELEPDICYRAIRSRDARFDGRFFTGVKSTGVYCRPVCPARTPKRSNCTFFRCPTEAQEAGYRPCLRCRPESSPGAPAWEGTSAVVSRALRLIQDGALEQGGVDDLAARLGVGARHLRRLFVERLGAAPVAIEQTRRVLFAKKLLDETDLSITRIALGSGFGSVRRFNSAMRTAYGRSPRELRRGEKRTGAPEAFLSLRLFYRPPFDWRSMLDFLERRAIPGVEQVDATSYRRSVELDGRHGTIEVRPESGASAVVLKVSSGLTESLARVVPRVRALFDLDADSSRIDDRLRRDPRLRGAVDAWPGLRVPGCWDRFELGVRAILGQQVSVRGAVTLAARLVEAYGEPLPDAVDGPSRLFPRPEGLASRRIARRIGMPESRARAIRAFARAVLDGETLLGPAAGLDDALDRLRAVRGFGDWTAQYVAMRALGEPDAFPASDLGVRRALAVDGAMPSVARAVERAEAWRPWRAYGVMRLWAADIGPSATSRRRGSGPEESHRG